MPAAAAWAAMVALVPALAIAQAPTLQDVAKAAAPGLPQAVIYTAREIVTLDPARPTAQAVAVVGDRILATGTLDELKLAMGPQPYRVDETFASQVIVPGLIAQHDHPLLAALTMTSEIIAIEDWVLPQGTSKAAKNHADYIKRLTEAAARMKDPSELLLTWGYHHYFHGELKKAELDAISATRPMIVWHRSGHEFYLNSAAEKKYGVTKAWFEKLTDAQKKQSDFANAHYWEQGWFAVAPLTITDVATPQRVRAGLELVESYYHVNGVTLGSEPGGVAAKQVQDAQNAVMSDPATPFRWYFIADGKSITGKHPDDKVDEETAKLVSWGQGMTAYLPRQVKLFADGAIFSQAMQVTKPYSDRHSGEWMMEPEFFARTMRVYWDSGPAPHPCEWRRWAGYGARPAGTEHTPAAARRPSDGDHPFRHLASGAGGPHQAAGRHCQRQSVLPRGARGQLPDQRARARARGRDGPHGRRGEGRHLVPRSTPTCRWRRDSRCC